MVHIRGYVQQIREAVEEAVSQPQKPLLVEWKTGTISTTTTEAQEDLGDSFTSIYVFNQGPNDVSINMGSVTDTLSVQSRTLEVSEAIVIDIKARFISHKTTTGTATLLFDAVK